MPDSRASNGSAKKRDKKNKKTTEKAATTTKSTTESKNSKKLTTQLKEVKQLEENNNINKSPNLFEHNTGRLENSAENEVIAGNMSSGNIDSTCTNIPSDSANIVIEEFDFDDTDLQELNDSEIGAEVDETAEEAICQSTVQILSEHEVDTSTNINKNIKANAIDNEVDKQVPKQITETNQVIPLDSTNTNESNTNSTESTKRKAVPPVTLELQETINNVTSDEPYCPITPRRIIDVEEMEKNDAPNRVLRSSSSKAIIGSKSNDANFNKDTMSTNDQVNASSTADDADNEEYYDDEPDDELLVQFLGEANRIAEARLAARRQARAEAREIRMRELERQQKEQEQNADRVFDMHAASGIDSLSRSRLTAGINSSSPVVGLLSSTRGNSMSSRRSSEDSLEEEGRSLRDIRHELRDVEERFRKAMIANAQLDNERASQTYQIQLLKDKLEEMEESYSQLQREFKEKSRDCNALKRNLDKLSEELKLVHGQLNERDTLITEQGLVIVTVENEDNSDAKRALVSCENAHLLGSVQGSLDVRLKKFNEEKQQLLAEVQQLQDQLENYKSQGKGRGTSMNGPTNGDEEYEAQREANKIISDFKYKLQKAEQEIANLQASLARSETQVIRYKSTAEATEKAEAELKIERRKLQRENREAMERLEELETSNNHLLKRLDKLKNAKSALLKDL